MRSKQAVEMALKIRELAQKEEERVQIIKDQVLVELLGENAPQDVALPLPKDGKVTHSVANARVEAALKNKVNYDWRQHIRGKLEGK